MPLARAATVALIAVALLGGCEAEGDSEPRSENDRAPSATPGSEDPCAEAPGTPSVPVAEITDVRVEHSQKAVNVDVHFSEIDPTLWNEVAINIATPRQGWSMQVNRLRQRGQVRVSTFFSKAPPEPEVPDEGCAVVGTTSMGEACPVRGRFDLEQSTVHATVPRTCMENPVWVRVGVEATYVKNREYAGSFRWNEDADPGSWLPPLGPEVPAADGAPVGCQERAPRVRDEPDGTVTYAVGKLPCVA